MWLIYFLIFSFFFRTLKYLVPLEASSEYGLGCRCWISLISSKGSSEYPVSHLREKENWRKIDLYNWMHLHAIISSFFIILKKILYQFHAYDNHSKRSLGDVLFWLYGHPSSRFHITLLSMQAYKTNCFEKINILRH